MPSPRRQIPRFRVAETVAAELRERILAADGADGYRLPTQDELVKEFGVGYPSVREAIRILETEGLVTVRRGNVGGAEIHRPDETSAAYHLGLALQGGRVTLGDLAASLQLFEPQCAAACAGREDRLDEVVPKLRASVDAAAALTDAGADFTPASREFHDLVVAFTPNATIRCVVGSLVALWSGQEEDWARSQEQRHAYPTRAEAESVIRAHRRILKEIEAGRPAPAEKAARDHLVATQAYVVDADDQIVRATALRPGRAGRTRTRWPI